MPETILANLRPELMALAQQHRAVAEKRGIAILFTEGFRTPGYQMALFTKGRASSGGIWTVIDPQRVVTNAIPEHAPHCRGAAYDLVPIVNEKPAWDRLDLFAVLGEMGEKLGLVWGGRWPKLKDMPHFELPNWRSLPLPT